MKSLERETRRRNLVIKGVANAERKREGETKDIILKIVGKTGVTIESNMQVDEARRLKRYKQDETRPILLKLTTRQKKTEILEHVKELKGAEETEELAGSRDGKKTVKERLPEGDTIQQQLRKITRIIDDPKNK
ncbi:hypothetical protein ILUMI_13458 [Ignelater luminosus]|uniref:Uncharacterized protein n=1 Tax=Ignelater luminosus TaxID=2038154 RepID=A0A8K0CUG5_IGNLU|nr:hypothetical protein ILUMI_13458 [Ignelater luminosus]